MSIEINGNYVLFGCPQCDRWKMDRAGYTSIPTIKRWEGRLELYTDVEMERCRDDRRFVIERRRAGKRATRIPGMGGIGRVGEVE